MNQWDKQQKRMFFGIIAFAIVCMTATIILMFTNEEDVYNNGMSDNHITITAIYQDAFQTVAKKQGQFVQETFIDDLNSYVSPEYAIFKDNGNILSPFKDEYNNHYVFNYVSTEHIKLFSCGKDGQANTNDDRYIDFLTYTQDNVHIFEMRTAKLLSCTHDYYEINNNATCTEAGIELFKCRKCGNAMVKWYPVIEHNFDNNICTICGKEKSVNEEGE